MAAENIGQLVPTKVPGYVDAADIQAALRLYHYGSYSFDINETDPAELVNPSIAYTLNDLQDQIDSLDLGISSSVLNAKGDLISASADNTPLVLSAGTSGQYLRVNSSTATGLEWSTLATPIEASLISAKGDLVVGTADNTPSVLSIGNDTYVLTADSSTASGMAWKSTADFGGGGASYSDIFLMMGA